MTGIDPRELTATGWRAWLSGGALSLLAGALLLPCRASGQWIEPPGEGWTQIAVYHQDTRREYGEDGRVRDFFANGHSVATSLFVTSAVGIAPGLDGWTQVNVDRLRFDDAAGERSRIGLGSARFWLRAGPELVGVDGPLPVAVRAGVKLPGSDFPVDAEVIPLNEGQRDWEVLLEAGHSLWPTPVYLQGWIGYRWRERNDEIRRDPGDEIFYYAAAGGDLGRLEWKLASQGTFGRAPTVDGITVPNGKRELVEISPRVGYQVGPSVVQVGVRVPVDGRNHPKGVVYTVGTFVDWQLF